MEISLDKECHEHAPMCDGLCVLRDGLSPSTIRDAAPMTPAMTDDELMARIAGGDEDAFRDLVLRWERRVYAFFFRCLGSREDAEDLAQETLRLSPRMEIGQMLPSSAASWHRRSGRPSPTSPIDSRSPSYYGGMRGSPIRRSLMPSARASLLSNHCSTVPADRCVKH